MEMRTAMLLNQVLIVGDPYDGVPDSQTMLLVRGEVCDGPFWDLFVLGFSFGPASPRFSMHCLQLINAPSRLYYTLVSQLARCDANIGSRVGSFLLFGGCRFQHQHKLLLQRVWDQMVVVPE